MGQSRTEGEKEVRSWGFDKVFSWRDGPYVIESILNFAFRVLMYSVIQECALPSALPCWPNDPSHLNRLIHGVISRR